MDVHLKIRRFDPVQCKASWDELTVRAEPTDTVLALLCAVQWEHDGTLALRRSCNHGVCGSDAMQINGRNRLACKTLVRDVGAKIVVAPLPGLRVIRDLIVDMDPFFAQIRSVSPFLIAREPPPERERLQTPKQRERFEDSSRCILCAACTSSCPSFWASERFIGPAAVVQAHRFLFDSRDLGADQRLSVLDAVTGVWRCRTIYNCTEACPRDIAITQRIGEVKKAILTGCTDA